MTSIIAKTRYLIEDSSTATIDIFTYEASSVFTLTESNPIAITTVYINNVATSGYTYSSTTKRVTITDSLTVGDTIQINYTAYLNYSDNELREYIQSALIYLSINNYYDFIYDSDDDTIYPSPETREKNLIASIAALLIKPNNTSIRLPNISITLPKDYPTNEKIAKLIATFKRSKEGVFDIIERVVYE